MPETVAAFYSLVGGVVSVLEAMQRREDKYAAVAQLVEIRSYLYKMQIYSNASRAIRGFIEQYHAIMGCIEDLID